MGMVRIFGIFGVALLLAQGAWAERANMADTRVTFAHAVKMAEPSVVNIYAAKVVGGRSALARDPRFETLLPGDSAARERIEKSLGSGVIVRSDGIVVTNLHVIEGASAIKVVLSDGREFAARTVGRDDKLDLAVLRLQVTSNERLPAATFGDSDSLQMGDVVLALGNPFGIGQSVSFGIVSAVERSAAALSPYARFIQTDAPINPGNSGGALIDSTGKVVGINSGIFSKSGASNGIGFAIPASLVQRVVGDIVTTGSVVRPWFGAEGQALTDDVARTLGLATTRGVQLTGVLPGSPAAAAGLRRGDVLLTLAGQPVADPSDLNGQILATPNLLNKAAEVTYRRGTRTEVTRVTLTALPPRAAQQIIKGYNPLTGTTVEELTPALNVELGLPLSTKGVAVTAVPARPPLAAFGLSLEPGDLILAINGNTIAAPRDVQGALDSSRQQWQLRFQRKGRVLQIMTQ
jgi:serine protease Do